jgi:hypothetical protein
MPKRAKFIELRSDGFGNHLGSGASDLSAHSLKQTLMPIRAVGDALAVASAIRSKIFSSAL